MSIPTESTLESPLSSGTVRLDGLCQVTVVCPPVTARYLQELLWTLDGVESVSENYQSTGDSDQTSPSDLSGLAVMIRLPETEDVTALENAAQEAIQGLLSANPKLGKVCRVSGVKAIVNDDWAEHWKQYWHPTQVTETLTICPSWEMKTYNPKPGERVIQLDPECAFGTGTHETTRLMLELFEKYARTVDLSQKNLIDIGTGSGILAIDAALLGCRDIKGLDNDPAAVETARRNAVLNGVASSTDFTDTPLGELCQTRYDVVLINIIAPVILELWDDILLRINPGATLIASGLIEKSVGQIETAMKAAGFTDIQTFRQNDWFALQGTAPE